MIIETQKMRLAVLRYRLYCRDDFGSEIEASSAPDEYGDWVSVIAAEELHRQLAEARSALAGIAEHAHAGGLDDETQWQALCEIRKLCLPWWDGTRTNERQAAAPKAARG